MILSPGQDLLWYEVVESGFIMTMLAIKAYLKGSIGAALEFLIPLGLVVVRK
jgi:hypothetical protein